MLDTTNRPDRPRKSRKSTRRIVERVIESASAHGDASEPGHEAGDLIDFLRLLAAEAGRDAVERAARAYWADHDDWTASGAAEEGAL
ncbi:MAG TPA: hypothetical protein VF183_13465 [Acidimicrobiales bacterium]